MIETIKGTRDILPDEIAQWHFVEAAARECFERFGFQEIRTPVFESTELFQRGIGEGTDIVAKEMYTFPDRKGRSLTLRPENTAPVARAYIEHQMHRRAEIVRLYYIGAMFRYERPQKGRMRQFYQIGVEVLGGDDPAIDAETLQMLMTYLHRLGIEPLRLLLNSVGCGECRPRFREALVRYLGPRRESLCGDCQRRIETNPLRCFDCKVEADQAIMKEAPVMLDFLCVACSEHFASVRSHLGRLGIVHSIDPRLVRGLDYYSRTAFEVTQPSLGAQNALLGGGRYDGLVESLGGPPVPGFGFAVGEDRLVMSLPPDAGAVNRAPEVFVAAMGREAVERALVVAGRLRDCGRRVVFDPLPVKSLKAQMRRANDLEARFVVILGEQEVAGDLVTLKRMSDGNQATFAEGDLEPRLQEMTRG